MPNKKLNDPEYYILNIPMLSLHKFLLNWTPQSTVLLLAQKAELTIPLFEPVARLFMGSNFKSISLVILIYPSELMVSTVLWVNA